jgi:hypothetical protein
MKMSLVYLYICLVLCLNLEFQIENNFPKNILGISVFRSYKAIMSSLIMRQEEKASAMKFKIWDIPRHRTALQPFTLTPDLEPVPQNPHFLHFKKSTWVACVYHYVQMSLLYQKIIFCQLGAHACNPSYSGGL